MVGPRAFVLALVSGVTLLSAGCATTADDDEPSADVAASELGALKYFDCRGSQDIGDTLNRIEFGYAKAEVRLVDVSRDATEPDTGKLDPSYAPTSATYAGSSRYVGFAKVADGLSSDVSRVDVMVSKEITGGGASGRIWLRTSGPEGARTDSYTCKAKPKALAVDTARPARLLCQMNKLICAPGAPPGDTCLSEFFVNQSADASLRLTWLDHFGVNVSERKEAIGAATKFTRTKKAIAGKWGKTTVDLTYRAGVTYTGSLKLEDGRSEKVHCSDLAMFDE